MKMKDTALNNTISRLDQSAFASVSAFIILRGANYVGRIQVSSKPASSTLYAFLWDWSGCAEETFSGAKEVGGGYDTLQAALSYLSFDGVPFLNYGQHDAEGHLARYWKDQLYARGFTVIQAI